MASNQWSECGGVLLRESALLKGEERAVWDRRGWKGTGFVCSDDEIGTGDRKKVRMAVGIGCSYGAVNACMTGDKPRSRRAWPQCLPAGQRQEWSQEQATGTRRLPKVP